MVKVKFHGLGFLVILLPIVAFVSILVVLPTSLRLDHIWPWGGGLLICGSVFLGLGIPLNLKVRRARQWQPRSPLSAPHELLFIKMEYWGGPFLLGGLVVIIIDLLGLF